MTNTTTNIKLIVGFEPGISAVKRLQTYSLVRTTIGIGKTNDQRGVFSRCVRGVMLRDCHNSRMLIGL